MKDGLVVVLSGGLDSAVLLWHLKDQGRAARAVTIDYGQRHACEIGAARRIAVMADVEHDVVDMHAIAGLLPGSSQTDPRVPVPTGHYQDATMRATVVPNRNMVLLSVALAIAVAHDLEGVAYGAHAGDHAIYPDCRPDFVERMQDVAACCDYEGRIIEVPFLRWTKGEIVMRGNVLGVPFAETWTCYQGGRNALGMVTVHCGECGACVERREAFRTAGIEDPTDYEA